MEANLRKKGKSYSFVDGELKKEGLLVLHEDAFEQEVQKSYGRFEANHIYGLRNVENELRKWHCVGLRQKLNKLCKIGANVAN